MRAIFLASVIHFAWVGVASGCEHRERPARESRFQRPPQASSAPGEPTSRPTLDRPLLDRFPGLRGKLPWLALATFPTPIERSHPLEARLGLRTLTIKRDDRAGDVYGGSKLRKLELLLGDAEARGFHSVLAQGGVGSNQTVATAFFAKQRNLHAILLLLPERPSDETRAHLLAQHALGAEQHLVSPSEREVDRFIAKLPVEKRPYVIPTGGSSPLGDIGFVNAGFELAKQLTPDVVYVPLGTGGSAVGLAIGLRAAGLETRVVAVRTASHRYGTPREIEKMRRDTIAFLQKLDPSFPDVSLDHLEVREGFVGRGYAEPTAGGKAAQALVRETSGLELDLTYSAKAFAALVKDAPTLSDRVVVFWLTYDARSIDVGNVSASELPSELRGYAR